MHAEVASRSGSCPSCICEVVIHTSGVRTEYCRDPAPTPIPGLGYNHRTQSPEPESQP